jgi:hypothetical protein
VRQRNIIAVANEKVPITTVLNMLGVDVADTRRKFRCPFGNVYHSDGGIAAAMRVYPDSNSCYCFSCTAYYTPVMLAARALDMSRRAAAMHLLDRIGYRGLDAVSAWRNAQEYEPELDKAMLADALKTYCRRVAPTWSSQQFEPAVSRLLMRCLGLLDLVRSSEDANLWLGRSKEAMSRVLQANAHSLSSKQQIPWEAQRDERRQA